MHAEQGPGQRPQVGLAAERLDRAAKLLGISERTLRNKLNRDELVPQFIVPAIRPRR